MKYKVKVSYEMDIEADNRLEAKEKFTDKLITIDLQDSVTIEEEV